MLPWDQLAKGLNSRAEAWTEEQQAAQRQRQYEIWAEAALARCFEDLMVECRRRVSHFAPAVSSCITVDVIAPGTRAGVTRALCLRLGEDEVHIHASHHRGGAPTLHLLWSRKRQGRYCQMVPIAGNKLLPRAQWSGYWMCALDGSSDEVSLEHLIYRALALLTTGSR